jgi:superfamily II DNA or RNA helicase
LWVPRQYVNAYHRKQFEYILDKRVADTGEETKELVVTYKRLESHYSFCRGNLKKIYKVFCDFDIEDQRAKVPIKNKIKFTGTLRENQKTVVDGWLEYGWGTISAPPRSGKTVILCNMICKLGQKTLFLAHQIDLLEQCYKRFHEFTNVEQVDSLRGKPVVGIVRDVKDLERFDICLSTWQFFNSGKGGIEAMRRYRDKFGMVVVDEAHRAASACFSNVVNNFNSYYRVAVTATPERKDKLHVVMYDVVGTVVVEGKTKQLTATVKYIQTGANPGKFYGWSKFISFLIKDKGRNQIIVDSICNDVKLGYSVIAVTSRVKHTKAIAKWLRHRGIEAEAFNGTSRNREEILNGAREGTIKVVIAMRSMMQGIDVPRWSSFYNLLPSANPHSYYQEFSRVLTPHPSKEDYKPVVKDLIDACHAAYACKSIRHKVYIERGCEFENRLKKIVKKKFGNRSEVEFD